MNIKTIIIAIAVFFAMIGLSFLGGCGAAKSNQSQPTTAPGGIEQSIAGVIDAQATRSLWTATPPPPNPTPEPPSIGELAATAAVQQMYYLATQQSIAFAQSQMQATTDARATQAQAAQNAAATATQGAWNAEYWSATQTAAAQQTAYAMPPTQTAYAQTQAFIPAQDEYNRIQLHAQETVIVGQAISVSVEANNAMWKSIWNVVLPSSAIAIALVIIGYYVYKAVKFHQLTPGTWSIEGQKGVKQVVQPSRMLSPVLTLDPATASAKPGGMVSEATQERVTERAQKVEALAAVPPPNPAQSFNLLNRLFSGGRAPVNINIVTPETVPLDDYEAGLNDID